MNRHSSNRGFTLLEVLFAALAFTVVVGALYSVLHGALRLRESASAPFTEGIPRNYALAVLERDLSNILVGSEILAGPVLGEKLQETSERRDRLEIYTASGSLDSFDPWGDVQKVEYTLEETEEGEMLQGYDLTRVTTRNLLAEVEEEPVFERLLPGVRSLTFAFFDGEEWQESWDSTATEGEEEAAAGEAIVEEPVLLAIRVSIGFAPSLESERVSPPLELIVPVVAQAPVNETEDEETGAEGGATGGEGGATGGGGGQ